MQSDAGTVEEYLAALPPDRRVAISTVRVVLVEHLPLDVLGEVVARIPTGELIARYEAPALATTASTPARSWWRGTVPAHRPPTRFGP